jgi:hypothetical protein
LEKTDRKIMQSMTGTVVKTGVIALALALAGCGGGGAGAPAPGAAVATPSPERTVQGTAAKGLIKGAKVSVYALDAQGVRGAAALATAITGADGTYKLQIAATVQNFVIEVSAAPGAVMADEATGTDLPLPADMKLRSVVTLANIATGTYEGTVSPLTEMVARTAETADGKLPQAAVAQAKTSVRTLLGFDPETVKPVNSNSAAAATASEDEKNQSLALAAISKMGSTATADCAQSTPGERISCVVTRLASSVKVADGQASFEQNRLAQFRDAIQAVAQDKFINRTGKDKVVGIPMLDPSARIPVVPALPPLAATKALFGSLRTNLRALEEGDAFRATADRLQADLNRNLVPLSNDAAGFATLSVNALEQLDRYRTGESTAETFDLWNYQLFQGAVQPLYTSFGRGSGNCVITKSPLSMSCTTIHFDYLEAGSSSTSLTWTRGYATRTVSFQPKAGSTREFTYTTSFAKNAVTYDRNNVATETPTQQIGVATSGEITFARSGNTITELAVKGHMPGRLDPAGLFQNSGEEWSLNATRTEEANGVALYKFGGVLTALTGATATQAGQPAGQVEIDSASFLRLALDGNNQKVLANAANELQMTLRGSVGSTTVNGTLHVWEDMQDKSKTTHMPTRLSFDGSLKHGDATVFSGKVAIARNGYENFDATAAESDTNFVADTIQISGALLVPNRPTLYLSLGATRVGLDAADVSAQYRDGTSVINASVTAKRGERHPLVKVSSADGVAFSFTDTSVPVKVTKDGTVTAELNLSSGIINYSDGSTESLK